MLRVKIVKIDFPKTAYTPKGVYKIYPEFCIEWIFIKNHI